MADEKKQAWPLTRPQDCDGGKRNFLRALFSPLSALAGKYGQAAQDNANVMFTENPPQQRAVIKGGNNEAVLALIGPLARGEAVPGGYRLARVGVEETHIDYFFERSRSAELEAATVVVRLAALDATGPTVAASASFRIMVLGAAPELERRAVAERVAHEVVAADRGHLWATASVAPRGEGRMDMAGNGTSEGAPNAVTAKPDGT